MDYSICIPAFFRNRSFEDSVRCIAHYGFHAAELWGWQDLDLERARDVLLENQVPSNSAYLFLSSRFYSVFYALP